jgi:hypothetical protein
MPSTTLDELAWLHDSELLSIQYDTSMVDARSIRLSMRCPTDLGYPPWEGKHLVLTANDVAASTHLMYGVVGLETIDAVRAGVSPAFQSSTIEARRMGVRFPCLELTICLSSGSSLEIICRDLQVNVKS